MANQDINPSAKIKSVLFYGYIVVIAALIIRMVMLGPRSSFGVFFKPLLTEFGWSRALVSGAFSVSSVIQGLSGIVMGGLNDRLGPRVVMTICGLLVGIGFLLMSRVNSAWQFYLFYVVIIGIGMGGGFTPPMSTVARWFVKRRSVMTGIVSAGGGIGGLFLPPLANWLIATHGWRSAFLILGALVLGIAIITAQLLRRDPSQKGQTPYGQSEVKEKELNSSASGLSLKEAIRTRSYWIAVSMFFCTAFCMTTITVHIVPHVTDLGFSAATAANILATISGAFLVGGITLGALADKIGNRRAYIICFLVMSAALLWLPTISEVRSFYMLAVVLGIGVGGANTLESPLVAELFGIKSHGFILGVCSLFFLIGSAVGPFIAGYIFDVRGSYQTAFLICAALGMVGIVMAVMLRPVNRIMT